MTPLRGEPVVPSVSGSLAVGRPSGATGASPARLAAARAMARRSKLALAAGGLAVFILAMVLSRATFAGHSKQQLRTLSPPPAFVEVVRQSALAAGVLAPTEAPPDAATAQS